MILICLSSRYAEVYISDLYLHNHIKVVQMCRKSATSLIWKLAM